MDSAEEVRNKMKERQETYIRSIMTDLLDEINKTVYKQSERGVYEASFQVPVGTYRPALLRVVERLEALGYKLSPFDEHSQAIYLSWEG